MQVKTTHPTDTKAVMLITADADTLADIKQKVLNKLNTRDLKLPGFRDGKAPLHLVEKHIDQSVLQTNFLDEAVNQLYVKAVTDENLRPVSQPEISLKKFVPFTDLEFEATLPVVGKITLPDYKKIKKTKAKATVTLKEVDDVMAMLQTRAAEKKEVERAAKLGDEVIIDFDGVDAADKPISGGASKDYPLVLGSNSFIPGFEDNIVGLQAGSDKTFTLKFPKDYNVKTLANQDVTFTVKVSKVQELTEPKLDDDFAAKVGPFKSVKELKDDIKKQLLVENQTKIDRAYENELLEDIVNKTKVAVPEVIIEQQIDAYEQEERQNLAYRGQTWEEHLKEDGVTAEEHRAKKRPEAEQRAKAGFVLSEIAAQEKIELTPEELEIRMQLLSGQYQQDAAMQAELSKPEARRDIASRMLAEKTLALLVTSASK